MLNMTEDVMTAVRGNLSQTAVASGQKDNGQAEPTNGAIPCSSSPVELSEEPLSCSSELTRTWLQFAKTFVVIFPIYVLGYFEFSFSWLLIALTIFFFWKRNTNSKNTRLSRAMSIFDPDDAVKQELDATELPSWVHYPDVERVEWLNKTVNQMWPYVCQFVDKLFKETIEPAIKESNAHLSTFSFTKIDLGDKPLRINGVKVYSENVDKRQIIMDLQISYVGNTEIDVDVKRYYCRAGIKSIQLHGVLRVILEPLLGNMPLVGAFSLFFLKKPLLDINWTGLTNILDIPGLNGFSDQMIQDIISAYMVLPNRITVPLIGEVELAQLRFPMPKGVLRIYFIEAQNLEVKDTYLGGLIKGKSDPYGMLLVSNQLFRSKTIKECLHPKWNEVYEALVYEPSGQHLEIELFDEDPDKDDFLGSLMIDLTELHKEQKVDEWFDLEEVTTGKLHLRLEWLSLYSSAEKLDQVQKSIRTNDNLSSALLIVNLDSASNLPTNPFVFNPDGPKPPYKGLKSGKKVSIDPNPFVKLTVGQKTCTSKVRYKTSEPLWEETFPFLINNPQTQELEIEVKDSKHKCSLGSLQVSLASLLNEVDMTLNQQFPLQSSGPNSTLKLKMALRILSLEKEVTSSHPSSVRVRITSQSNTCVPPKPQATSSPTDIQPSQNPPCTPPPDTPQGKRGSDGSPVRLADAGRSLSSLGIGSSHKRQSHRDSTPSLASDISLPCATLELQQRLQQLQNGSGLNLYPLGEVQLTVRHSSQRNKLIVVVHACRNLIALNKDGSDPYIRLYLLPDKSRSGRRKTSTLKKTLNPIYDQSFEFSVSMVELHRRTLDIAVKNGGGLLSKNKLLLGKTLVDLGSEDISKGWTHWYHLTEDGAKKLMQT
ncbi:extended synaptotagmin-2 isoform X3 [Danio rerio]|uniref:Extended synaptotagmin-2 isoform X3 n=3 Tax=Danio rerio TaxID=7955 RepID=A0A8M2BDU7_DANRE|nr:extended synaptotagmin-2 isoform X2 [Danio rerio]|eukprot:XP_005166502.1 extended synaptotagmin-2 isoform X2 [Danio rerio]